MENLYSHASFNRDTSVSYLPALTHCSHPPNDVRMPPIYPHLLFTPADAEAGPWSLNTAGAPKVKHGDILPGGTSPLATIMSIRTEARAPPSEWPVRET